MIEIRRILCPIDFSDYSRRALDHAVAIARWWYDSTVTVLHVFSVVPVVPQTVRAHCAVETVLAAGQPYREILRVASEQRGDLSVIGIHGRGAADLLFFGWTQHVVREAICPVLTLRGGDHDRRRSTTGR